MIKSKGKVKIMTFDNSSQKITFYNSKLEKENEATVPEKFGEKVNQIKAQKQSVLLVMDSQIGFYKLTTNSFANSTSTCQAEEGSQLSSVVFPE